MSDGPLGSDFGDWHWDSGAGYYINIATPKIVHKKVTKTGYVLKYESQSGQLYHWEMAQVTVGGQAHKASQVKTSDRAVRAASLPPSLIFALHTTPDLDPSEAATTWQCNSQLLASLAGKLRVKVEGYQLVLDVGRATSVPLSNGQVVPLEGKYVDAFLRDFMRQNPNPYVTHVTFLS